MAIQTRHLVAAGIVLTIAGLLALVASVTGAWELGRASSPVGAPLGGSAGGGAVSPTPGAPNRSTPTSAPAHVTTLRGSQVFLEIPSIRVSEPVRPEGLVGGKINPAAGDVAWFTGYGRVKPGQVGTAVVSGHIVANGRPDTFYDLDKLHRGAVVRIHDAAGTTISLTVVQTLTVDKHRLQTNQTVWGRNTTVQRIALVTCDDALGLRPDGHRVANFVVVAEVT